MVPGGGGGEEPPRLCCPGVCPIVENRMRNLWAAVAGVMLIFSAAAMGASDNASAPEAAGSTRPYHAAQIPTGFHALTVGSHTAICLPSDDGWMTETMTGLKPVTRPSTIPSDLTNAIGQRRAEWVRQIVGDLGLADSKGIDEAIDTQILPALEKLEKLKPQVFFLAVSRANLAQLMDGGWSDPRFRYLRFANDVAYDKNVVLSAERRTDDLVMWAEIQDDSSAAQKKEKLAEAINDFDNGYVKSVSLMAQQGIGNVLDEFIRKKVLAPLNLPARLQWFEQGVAAVYAVKFSATITGVSRSLATAILVRGDWRNPLQSQPLDLLEPLNQADMEPRYLVIYHEALYHKAASAIAAWVAKGGDGVLAKTLPVLRNKPPTSSADLINVVQEATGIDLTPVMLPNFKGTIPQL
jgi:hypothetical protein